MLEDKLESTLVRYVHLDQLGIIVGRLFANAIMRALDLLYKNHKPVISLDAEQAFIWIEWQYTYSVLGRHKL